MRFKAQEAVCAKGSFKGFDFSFLPGERALAGEFPLSSAAVFPPKKSSAVSFLLSAVSFAPLPSHQSLIGRSNRFQKQLFLLSENTLYWCRDFIPSSNTAHTIPFPDICCASTPTPELSQALLPRSQKAPRTF